MDGGWRFSTKVTFPTTSGGSETLNLMIDSGSSTAAVCDYSDKRYFAATASSTVSCNLYGTGSSGYQGPFVEGSMSLSGTSQQLPSSHYAFMQYHQSMPCNSGYDGIFGIAYKGMDSSYSNSRFAQEATSYDSAARWCQEAQQEGAAADYKAPLIQTLTEGTGTNSHLWGLYYSGNPGDNAGTLYLGNDAKTNTHFTTGGTPVIARMYNANDFGSNWAFYNVQITKFVVGSTVVTTGSWSSTFAQGVVDTGTPIFELPSAICEALQSNPSQSLLMYINDVNGQVVPINLGTGQMLNTGGPQGGRLYSEAQSSQQYIMGWPIWLTQYTVMDVGNRQMYWVSKPK